MCSNADTCGTSMIAVNVEGLAAAGDCAGAAGPGGAEQGNSSSADVGGSGTDHHGTEHSFLATPGAPSRFLLANPWPTPAVGTNRVYDLSTARREALRVDHTRARTMRARAFCACAAMGCMLVVLAAAALFLVAYRFVGDNHTSPPVAPGAVPDSQAGECKPLRVTFTRPGAARGVGEWPPAALQIHVLGLSGMHLTTQECTIIPAHGEPAKSCILRCHSGDCQAQLYEDNPATSDAYVVVAVATHGCPVATGTYYMHLATACAADNGGCAQICLENEGGVPTCSCHPGFTTSDHGASCVPNDCNGNAPCLNGGTCVGAAPDGVCDCSAFWTGATCAMDVLECSVNNGGCAQICLENVGAPPTCACGVCGCTEAAVDSDGDGAADCIDGCKFDATKTVPGMCGCGVLDTDSDGDGTPDCLDACASDPSKVYAGVCGCGVSDRDVDGDGSPDCNDGCRTDPTKSTPGLCGCGAPDVDSNADGVVDCLEPPYVPATYPVACTLSCRSSFACSSLVSQCDMACASGYAIYGNIPGLGKAVVETSHVSSIQIHAGYHNMPSGTTASVSATCIKLQAKGPSSYSVYASQQRCGQTSCTKQATMMCDPGYRLVSTTSSFGGDSGCTYTSASSVRCSILFQHNMMTVKWTAKCERL